MDHDFLFNIFVFMASACLIVPLASRFKLGAVLGYLVTGALIGPDVLALIDNPEQVMHFAEFGVVMMLFVIGLELEPVKLWKMRKHIVGLGGLQVLLTSLALAITGMALGYDWRAGLAVGMALSLSSTALVVQILQERNLMQTAVGEAAFAVLLFQDIAVIPILLVLPLLAAPGAAITPATHDLLAGLPGWAHGAIVAAVIAGVIIGGHFLSRHFFRIIARTNLREVFTATSLALVVGVTLLMQFVGVSPALGAFIAGVVLANSEYKRTLETDLEPFKGLLLGLFFISVGMGINFKLITEAPWALAGTVALFMIVKGILLFALGRYFNVPQKQNIGFAIGLSQGGEFNFVLFPIIAGLAIISPPQAAFLTLAVAISIGVTPLLILVYNRYIVPLFMSMLPNRPYDAITGGNRVIIAGYGRFGQIIGRFLLAQGIKSTILEKNPDQIDTLRKFGVRGYFGDATRLDLLKSAGADKAEILVVAVNDADVSLKIVRMARAEFPGLKIFARARNRRHAYELHKAGISHFKRDTFDSSLALAQLVMTALGSDPEETQHKAAKFRYHDETTLRQSFEFFENEPDLVNFARLRAAELEGILQSDASSDDQANEPIALRA